MCVVVGGVFYPTCRHRDTYMVGAGERLIGGTRGTTPGLLSSPSLSIQPLPAASLFLFAR